MTSAAIAIATMIVRAQRDRNRRCAHADDARVDLDLLVTTERLRSHERDEHDRREQVDDGLHVPWKRALSDENRPGRFARDGRHADDRNDDPCVAHRRSPRRHAAEAAMIGTPAGVNGIRTSVIPAASAAASTRTAIAEIRHRKREEERRERCVEAEGVRVVQHSADHGSERRAPDPEDVQQHPRADENRPLEASPAPRQRP